jgi:hypothetical protein
MHRRQIIPHPLRVRFVSTLIWCRESRGKLLAAPRRAFQFSNRENFYRLVDGCDDTKADQPLAALDEARSRHSSELLDAALRWLLTERRRLACDTRECIAARSAFLVAAKLKVSSKSSGLCNRDRPDSATPATNIAAKTKTAREAKTSTHDTRSSCSAAVDVPKALTLEI